ncbi:hypothetical protein BDZ89DRAFT_1050163 [Hymenopellis radicata]|nr:hypothetical protein BDZ89DRAFT_1050163 [Hymenopellis radicata]
MPIERALRIISAPALKAAFNDGRVVILPSDDLLHQLLNLQNSNEAVRFENKRLFFEAVPFGTYEYRVIPLKKNVTLYAKDPVNQTITPLDPSSFTISSDIHPFFLVAYATSILQQHLVALNDDLRRLLVHIRIHWAVLPCLEFVQGSYEGEFGRHRSFDYMKRRHPLTSASTSTSTCSARPFKRLRSSSPATDDNRDVDIRVWVAKCDPNNFDPVVDNDADVGPYRLEAVASTIHTKDNTPLMKNVAPPKRRNPKRKRA